MRITKPNPHPTQTAAPIHHLTAEALAHFLAALPALLPHAPPEWHRSRRKQITRQIAWLHPDGCVPGASRRADRPPPASRRHSAMLRDACVRTPLPGGRPSAGPHGGCSDAVGRTCWCRDELRMQQNACCPRPARRQQTTPRPRQLHLTAATPYAQTHSAPPLQPPPKRRQPPPPARGPRAHAARPPRPGRRRHMTLKTDTPAAPTPDPPPQPGRGLLRNGNHQGNPQLAPRCGAKARTTGCPCKGPAMPNGRCRMHGGTATGPRTPQGKARMIAARTRHGRHGAAGAPQRAQWLYVWTLCTRSRLTAQVDELQPYLPPDMAARAAQGPDELWAPVHPSNLPYVRSPPAATPYAQRPCSNPLRPPPRRRPTHLPVPPPPEKPSAVSRPRRSRCPKALARRDRPRPRRQEGRPRRRPPPENRPIALRPPQRRTPRDPNPPYRLTRPPAHPSAPRPDCPAITRPHDHRPTQPAGAPAKPSPGHLETPVLPHPHQGRGLPQHHRRRDLAHHPRHPDRAIRPKPAAGLAAAAGQLRQAGAHRRHAQSPSHSTQSPPARRNAVRPERPKCPKPPSHRQMHDRLPGLRRDHLSHQLPVAGPMVALEA